MIKHQFIFFSHLAGFFFKSNLIKLDLKKGDRVMKNILEAEDYKISCRDLRASSSGRVTGVMSLKTSPIAS